MSSTRLVRTTFNGGEVAPELQWRTDLQRFQNGCRRVQNFMLRPSGAAQRRPGTRYIRDWDDTGAAKLVPFEFSGEVYYLCVFREVDGAVVLDIVSPGGGVVQTLKTQYPAGGLGRIQWAQSYDVLFLSHPEVPLMRLERLSPTSFRLREQDMRGGPYKDQNSDGGVSVRVNFEHYIPERDYQEGDCVAVSGKTPPRATATGVGLHSSKRRVAWLRDGQLAERWYARLGVTVDDRTGFEPGMVVLLESGRRAREGQTSLATEWEPYPIVEIEELTGDTGVLVLESGWFAETEAGEPDWVAPWTIGLVIGMPRPEPPSWRDMQVDSEGVLQNEMVDGDLKFARFSRNVLGSSGISFDDRIEAGDVSLVPEYTGRAYGQVLLTSGEIGPTLEDPLGNRGAVFAAGRDGQRIGLFSTPVVVTGMFAYQPVSPWAVVHRFGDYVGGPAGNFPYWGNIADKDGDRETRPFAASGTVRLRTEGSTWNGKLALQFSRDGSSWENLGILASQGYTNGEIERDLPPEGGLVRVAVLAMTKTEGNATAPNRIYWRLSFEPVLPEEYRIEAELMGRGHFGLLRGVHTLGRRETTFRWALGAYGGEEGHPGALTIHEERMWLSGGRTSPNTVHASATNNWNLFAPGTLDTDAIAVTIASDQLNRIHWLRSRKDLIIGCDDSEWAIGARERDRGLAPSNVRASRQAAFGSEPVAPAVASDLLAYIQRGGLRIRGVRYSWESEDYSAADLTAVASHIHGEGAFTEVHYAPVPFSMLLALRDDGQIAVLTWDPDQQVDGWARWMIGQGVASLCIAPGGRNGRQAWMLVRRGTEQQPKLVLEVLDPGGTVFLDCHTEALARVVDGVLGVWYLDLPPDSVLGLEALTYVGDGLFELGRVPSATPLNTQSPIATTTSPVGAPSEPQTTNPGWGLLFTSQLPADYGDMAAQRGFARIDAHDWPSPPPPPDFDGLGFAGPAVVLARTKAGAPAWCASEPSIYDSQASLEFLVGAACAGTAKVGYRSFGTPTQSTIEETASWGLAALDQWVGDRLAEGWSLVGTYAWAIGTGPSIYPGGAPPPQVLVGVTGFLGEWAALDGDAFAEHVCADPEAPDASGFEPGGEPPAPPPIVDQIGWELIFEPEIVSRGNTRTVFELTPQLYTVFLGQAALAGEPTTTDLEPESFTTENCVVLSVDRLPSPNTKRFRVEVAHTDAPEVWRRLRLKAFAASTDASFFPYPGGGMGPEAVFNRDQNLGSWIASQGDVVDGEIVEPGRWKRVAAGIRYQSMLVPLPALVAEEAYGGTVNLDEATLYLLDSWGGEVSVDGGETWTKPPMQQLDGNSAFEPRLVTGPVRVKLTSGFRGETGIAIRADSYLPFTLGALGASVRRYS